MNVIFADFNAMTEDDHVCLTTRGSRADLEKSNVRIGDWVWLSDGELVVGARVANDAYQGVVGIPDWETLVHLDAEETQDFPRVWNELRELLEKTERSDSDERRILQLLTISERIAPPEALTNVRPGFFAYRRAGALLLLKKAELALVEIEEARRAAPGNANNDHLFLEILRTIDPPRAIREAMTLAERPDAPAVLLVACINVLAAHTEQLPDDQFEESAHRLLHWIDRFEKAPDREQVRAFMLAEVQFNHGLALLRRGRVAEAHRTFEMAHAANPDDPGLREATTLVVFDPRATAIAHEVRRRALAANVRGRAMAA